MSNEKLAVVAREFGEPGSFDILPLDPGDPGPGQIRIAIAAAGVSFVDHLIASGSYQVKPPLPFVPGSEFAGTIDAVGPGGNSERIGERVMGSGVGGGFANYAIVQADAATPVPDGMGFEEAAIFKVSYSTAYHALVQRGRLKSGETLLVLGAGGAVGLAAIEIGKALGAHVIASAGKLRHAVAERAGADAVIESRSETWREDLGRVTGGRGPDVVLDPVGGLSTEPALRSIAWNGRHLVIGFAAGSIPKISTNLALLKGASIVGVDIRQFGIKEPGEAARNIEALFALYDAGLLRPLVGRVYPMTAFAQAMDEAFRGTADGRVVLCIGGHGR